METWMEQEPLKLDWEDRIRKAVKKQGTILYEIFCMQGNRNYVLACLVEGKDEAKILTVGEDGNIQVHANFPLPYESCYRKNVIHLLIKSFQAWKEILSVPTH